MATLRAITPPPPPTLAHTPSTPRFGYADNYEPYSPRRKSARVSQRSQITQTPRKTAPYNDMSSSPPSSPQTASKRLPKKPANIDSSRRVSGALTHDATASAAAALGLQPQRPTPKVVKVESRRSTTLIRNNGMLPTPDKTPKKRPSGATPAITAIARTLFSSRSETVDEAMPSPKKKGRKKFSGFTLDSFGAEEEGSIQIYTDSHDRVPEVDTSTDNPFHGAAAVKHPEPTKRTSKRRKIAIPGEGEQTIDEVTEREDGMVVVL